MASERDSEPEPAEPAAATAPADSARRATESEPTLVSPADPRRAARVELTPDLRLSLAVSDIDLSRDTGSDVVTAPIDIVPHRLFYDDYHQVDAAYDTGAQLLLRATTRSLGGIEVEAALAGLVNLARRSAASLHDDSTYIRVGREFADGRVSAVAFPFNADPLRLGYAYGASWGGDEIFKSSPIHHGIQLAFARQDAYVYLAARSGLAPGHGAGRHH